MCQVEMATPGSLMCSEEMMEESPDVSEELEERQRYQNQLPPQLIRRHREITASDEKILQDERVFPAMLQNEKLYAGYVNNYFQTVQNDLSPEMKKDVAIWMFEVCDEERMNTAVFIRAVQYMDKFLSIQRISRTQLQLLGAVCVLVSSKMAGTLISARTLVAYTANSVTTDMLLVWENFVLSLLQWDINGIVSADFVQPILNMIPKKFFHSRENEIYERIKTYISYCAVDCQLGVYLPSTVASASIVIALDPFLSEEKRSLVRSKIQSATNIDSNVLNECIDQMKMKVTLTVVEGGRKNLTSGSDSDTATNSPPKVNGCGIKAR